MELYLTPIKALEKKKRNPENGQWLSGTEPWNKGMKGLNIGGVNTQFKKGNLSHNNKKNGTISIRVTKGIPYKYIKIEKGKWALLHRHVWEIHNNILKKGMIIRFIDSDTFNCDIKNLECITQAENMKRNRNRKKASKTMKELWKSEKRRNKYGLETETKWFNK